MNRPKIWIPVVAFLVAFLLLLSANTESAYATSPTVTLNPTLTRTRELIQNTPDIAPLELKVDSLNQMIQIQSNVYDAAVRRMESNMNLLLAIMAIVSLLVGIIGFGIVRYWVKEMVEKRLDAATEEEIKHAVEQEIARTRAEWDNKFAVLYEEYRKSIPRK